VARKRGEYWVVAEQFRAGTEGPVVELGRWYTQAAADTHLAAIKAARGWRRARIELREVEVEG
jgi:hypothetical protein